MIPIDKQEKCHIIVVGAIVARASKNNNVEKLT